MCVIIITQQNFSKVMEMKRKLTIIVVTLSFIFLASYQAQAAIINYADVGGFSTFQDQNTGRIWLDLDNFFNKSTSEMDQAASNAGFTFAAVGDVNQLLNSLPLGGGEWSAYKSIMGDAPYRELIWGSYNDLSDPANMVGWAFAYGSDTSWRYRDNIWDKNGIPNNINYPAYTDMNIWAYTEETPVIPEPATLSLLSLGLFGLAFKRKKIS